MSRILARLFLASIVVFIPSLAVCSSLQDWEFNVNGTDYYPAGGSTLGSVPGLNSGSFNSTTGQGTLTITFNPGAAGNYYVGAFFFVPVSTPDFNEYGAANGSPAAGQTWQIDIPEYDAVSSNHGNGTIVDNLASEALSDGNSVPGTTSNFNDNCGANGGGAATASCNDLVSMALGFNFTLTSSQYEIITLTLGTSNPGGFSVEDIHPVDGSNPTAGDLFYSGSAATFTVGTSGVPEPASLGLFALAAGVLAFAGRRQMKRS